MKSKIKTAAKWIAAGAFLVFACWQLAQIHYWRQAWASYHAGGGVLVHDPVKPEEMQLALDNFRTCARLNPLSTKYANYCGQALQHLERYDEALSEFDRSIALSPRSFTANYERAFTLKQMKRYDEMVPSLKIALSIQDPLNHSVRFSEEFADVRDEPFMQEFADQY